MVRSHYGKFRKSVKEKKNPSLTRKNGGACSGGRKNWPEQGLQARRYCPSSTLALERKAFKRRHCGPKTNENRASTKDLTRGGSPSKRQRKAQGRPVRNKHRIAIDKKKKQLGLEGNLRGRHLSKDIRGSLVKIIIWGLTEDENLTLAKICNILEINPRAYYRWTSDSTKDTIGGGGKNKITPLEEKRIVAMAKKNPEWHCRKIAYQLEKKALAFVGKTTVAKVMKAHGLNHLFEQNSKPPQLPAGDMLLYEPWRKNLVWGMDWTWVNVGDKFMYLLVLIDWYSRKILSWGLHHQITKFEVVSLVTNASAIENLDKLNDGELRPIVVADHGSANASKYTKENIEILGLTLWLSGIGRPTGNARTERVIGTLKNEEIKLQERYDDEDEAHEKIKNKILEYNFERPNSGNGGFSPNAVHIQGRYALEESRKNSRQTSHNRRRIYWNKETPVS